MFLSWFHFIVTYRPSSKKVKADALSCQFEGETNINNPETIIPASLVVAPIQSNIMAELDQANAEREIPADFRNRIMESVHFLTHLWSSGTVDHRPWSQH